MNIYRLELKRTRKSTLLWILSLCAGTAFLFWMYPAFADNTVALNEILKNYPEALQVSFGLSGGQIGSIPGFYSFIVTFLILCGAVQATSLGITALSGETAGKTADFLLTKPLPRHRVITAKLLAALTDVVLTSAAFVGSAVVMAIAVRTSEFDWTPFMLMSLAFLWVQVIFVALGLLTGAVAIRIRSVLPVSLSMVFGFFIVGMAAATLEVRDLYYLSPFKYFDTTEILRGNGYHGSFVLTAILVTGLSILLAYLVYIRRDIHSA